MSRLRNTEQSVVMLISISPVSEFTLPGVFAMAIIWSLVDPNQRRDTQTYSCRLDVG